MRIIGRHRVLLVAVRPSAGGVTEHMFTLAESLVRSGHGVAIATHWHSRRAVPARSRFEVAGIRTYQVPFPELADGVRGVLRGVLGTGRATRALRGAMRDFDPTVIHTHWRSVLPLVRLLRRSGTPIVHTVHGAQLIESRATRLLAGMPDVTVLINDELRLHWHRELGIPEKRLRAIPNGVSVPAEGPPDIGDLQPSLPIHVISVARLDPVKRPLLVLDIAERLRERGVNFRISLVGDGSMRNEIEREMRDRCLEDVVQLLGWVANPTELLRDSDAFLLMSDAEAFPVSVLEAMMAGLPVVRTKSGGHEQVDDGVSGFLIEKGDVQGAAACLELLSEDAELRRSMAKAAWHRARERYSADAMTDALLLTYDEFLAGKSRS